MLRKNQQTHGYGIILIHFEYCEFTGYFLDNYNNKLTLMNENIYIKNYEDQVNTNDSFLEKSFEQFGCPLNE